ncbi:hypothetical protein N172_15440 [Pantoea dispersa EGD-AAK13]|nr:hypothetical protein N172_15440 [Pantoea dispersa EGD-AAK13]
MCIVPDMAASSAMKMGKKFGRHDGIFFYREQPIRAEF